MRAKHEMAVDTPLTPGTGCKIVLQLEDGQPFLGTKPTH